MQNQSKKIEFLFPKNGSLSETLVTDDLSQFAAVAIDDITKWFKDYQVESIEISVSGVLETGGILKLLLSARGQAGLTLTLKPRNSQN